MNLKDLPELGAQLDGGVFVGVITQPDGSHNAVTLLADRAQDLTWQTANAWAAGLNAQLPTPLVCALIIANTQDRPQDDWYWTDDSSLASRAGLCHFTAGYQYFRPPENHKSPAVAVRLIHITV